MDCGPERFFARAGHVPGMSLAAETRRAVRERPFLYDALRAGVINYSAAARYLDLGEEDAAVAALRRYAEELPDVPAEAYDVRVTMHSGVGPDEEGDDALLSVGDTAFTEGGGSTAVLATGAVDAALLRQVLGRFAAEEVTVEAAGVAGESVLVVVDRRDGADAVRIVEDAAG